VLNGEQAVTDRTRTRLDRERRREQIIDAATRVIGEGDPYSVTFEEIADAAGVSRALVYNYFGDRRGLVAEVYRRHIDRLHERIRAALHAGMSASEAVTAVVRAHVEYALEQPAGYRHAAAEDLTGTRDHQPLDRIDAITAPLGGGPEADLVARCLTAAVEGAVLGWLDRRDVLSERVIELIATLAWSGVARVHATHSPTSTSP